MPMHIPSYSEVATLADWCGTLPGAALTPGLLRLAGSLVVTPTALVAWGVLAAAGSDTTDAKSAFIYGVTHAIVGLAEITHLKFLLSFFRPDTLPYLATNQLTPYQNYNCHATLVHTLTRLLYYLVDTRKKVLTFNDLTLPPDRLALEEEARREVIRQIIIIDSPRSIFEVNGVQIRCRAGEQADFFAAFEQLLIDTGVEELQRWQFLDRCHQGFLGEGIVMFYQQGTPLAAILDERPPRFFSLTITPEEQSIDVTEPLRQLDVDEDPNYPHAPHWTLHAHLDLQTGQSTYTLTPLLHVNRRQPAEA